MRARWLKPEFFKDRKIGKLGPITGLVFEALWCMADDYGTALCTAEIVKGEMFMYWPSVGLPEISGALQGLAEAKRIIRYTIGDDEFAIIINFPKHQKVHNPSQFKHPAPLQEVTTDESQSLGSHPEDIGSPSESVGSTHILDSYTPRHLSSTTTRVRERLADDGDKAALDLLLSRVPEPDTWAAECDAMLDGMGGHVKASPALLGKAIRDLTANGKLKSPSLRQFRNYVKGAAAEDVPSVKSNGNGTVEAAVKLAAGQQLEELQKLKVRTQTQLGVKFHIPRESLEALPTAVKSAIAALGGSLSSGAQRILDADGKEYGFVLSQFTQLYAGAIQSERARISA